MRFRKPVLPLFFASWFKAKESVARRKYDLQAAPDFLFQRTLLDSDRTDRTADQPMQPGIRLVSSTQLPYLRTKLETLVLSYAEFPALTIAADPSNSVTVCGNTRTDWSLRFCGRGEGNTEAEALNCLQEVSMTRIGSAVRLNAPDFNHRVRVSGKLIADGPADAPIIVHASFGAVEVRDMNGPIRVTATHGRATILGTTGQVYANGFVVDFAGSKGKVILSAEAEINLKLNTRFEGALLAWAQRPLRVLVPNRFLTPFQAIVNHPKDFLCRTDFCSKVTREKKGGLYVFTYAGDGATLPEQVHLRSEQATVVIDTAE